MAGRRVRHRPLRDGQRRPARRPGRTAGDRAVPGGGPAGRTDILVTESFNLFQAGQYAQAATYSVIILSLLLVFVTIYQRVFRTEEVAR